MIQKSPKADLRSLHVPLSLAGLILALLFVIAGTHIKIAPSEKGIANSPVVFSPDTLIMPPPTKIPDPPAPHKPSVLAEIPNHQIPEDEVIEFDTYELGEKIIVPPPPEPKQNEIYSSFAVEIPPEMKNGIKSLYSKLTYPEMARRAGIEGIVYVRFIVDENGTVTEPEIIRSLGAGCDEEVLRVIREIEFTPGIQNGRFVAVKVIQGVRFQLKK